MTEITMEVGFVSPLTYPSPPANATNFKYLKYGQLFCIKFNENICEIYNPAPQKVGFLEYVLP